jgi:hypothetical protein
MAKTEVKLIKPTYVGMSILDISKAFMYAFHYDKIVEKYNDKAKLLMTDTDSLIYWIETPDFYVDLLSDLDAYDTSDYPRNHPAYTRKNAKVRKFLLAHAFPTLLFIDHYLQSLCFNRCWVK